MTDIVEFLRARYAEDHAAASAVHHDECATREDFATRPCDCGWPQKIQQGVNASLQILELYTKSRAIRDELAARVHDDWSADDLRKWSRVDLETAMFQEAVELLAEGYGYQESTS